MSGFTEPPLSAARGGGSRPTGHNLFGEVSKTQPIPPPGLRADHQGTSFEDLINLTPELKQKALDNVRFLDMGPVYTAPAARGLALAPGNGSDGELVAYALP